MAATSDCLDQPLRSVQLGIKSNFRVPFPTTSNLCKHYLRKCLEDVRKQGVNNANTQIEALGGPWPGDLRLLRAIFERIRLHETPSASSNIIKHPKPSEMGTTAPLHLNYIAYPLGGKGSLSPYELRWCIRPSSLRCFIHSLPLSLASFWLHFRASDSVSR